MSHTRRHIVSPARRCVERQARQCVLSPSRRYAVNSAHELALALAGRSMVSPARRLITVRPSGEIVLGPVIELTVKPAEGYAGENSISENRSP